MSPARPVPADRVASVPAGGCFADRIEDAAPRRGQLGHLDDCAGMTLVEEIDERAARALAALADRPAVLHGPVEQLIVVLGPARPMLHRLVTGRDKLPIDAGRLVALLPYP